MCNLFDFILINRKEIIYPTPVYYNILLIYSGKLVHPPNPAYSYHNAIDIDLYRFINDCIYRSAVLKISPRYFLYSNFIKSEVVFSMDQILQIA